MGFDLVDPRSVACDEETRVASAVADIAAEHVPWCGGVLCRDEAGTWANMALGCAMQGERVTAQDVADLIGWYESRGIEPFVEACSYSDQSLLRRLAEAGFVLREMELVLAGDPGAVMRSPWEAPEELIIQRVDPDDPSAVDGFARVVTRAFYEGREDPIQFELMARAARHPRAINLLARLDGEPVGGASLDVSGDLGGLYLGAVMPAARRRGVQRALMLERLELAAACDCRLATVGTLPGAATERNARRCGLMPCYTRVSLVRPGEGLVPSS